MIFKEMVELLRINCGVEIRDESNCNVCFCESNSRGIEPYLDKEVVEWFVASSNTFCVGLNLGRSDEE